LAEILLLLPLRYEKLKYALFGDIHANSLALEAVLDRARVVNIDTFLVTGDLVGYYYQPLRVIELLQTLETCIVRGNHEDMLREARVDTDFLSRVNQRYGLGLQKALEQLDQQQLDALCSLPHPLAMNLDGRSILLCHGSPWDNDIYVYPDTDLNVFDGFKVEDFDLIVLGHTHYPMSKKIGDTLIVNPGSVGQPRNRQPGAQWAIYDSEKNAVEFRSEAYDASDLIRQCLQNDPELPYLHQVLTRT
jgi:putative phosphoesterase